MQIVSVLTSKTLRTYTVPAVLCLLDELQAKFPMVINSVCLCNAAFSSAEVGSKISVLTALLLVAVSLLVSWFD